ncbi:MAG: energy transducer TonB [Lewinellaceae bacterium]|nr:energy transducer TonB [Lewinellaceae bacterium]
MKKFFFLVGGLTFFMSSTTLSAQNQNSTQESYDPIFKIVEEMPMILECYGSGTEKEMQNCSDSKLATFIAENLEYPEQAKLNKTQGKAVIQFVVNKDSTIQEIRIARNLADGCGDAAYKVIEKLKNSPIRWRPGHQRAKPVSVLLTLPIEFKLPN